MIINTEKINKLLSSKELIVEGVEKCNEPSITIHFGTLLKRYKSNVILDPTKDNSEFIEEIIMPESGYILEPGEFVLISSQEQITMSKNHLGYLITRTALAKVGLQSHLCSPHIDPGMTLHVTFELKNNANNQVVIYPKMAAAKMIMFEIG
jgi:dCTP deaminase